MNIDKFKNHDYVPDAQTKTELEALNKSGEKLSGINLKHADMEDAYLVESDISESDLTRANFKNVSMYGSNLEGSNLFKANFEGANLKNSNLRGCNLLGANLTNTKLENVDWGDDYKVVNEIEAEDAIKSGDVEKARDKYKEAEDVYRAVKLSLQSQTLGDETGEFFIREMIAKRKQFPKFSLLRLGSKLIDLTTGYGEKMGNIAYTMLGIIISSAILFGLDGVSYNGKTVAFETIGTDIGYSFFETLVNLFYFSVVTYSTVGYGEILPIGLLGKIVMMFEGMIGGIVMSVFIIAMYKKTMDR